MCPPFCFATGGTYVNNVYPFDLPTRTTGVRPAVGGGGGPEVKGGRSRGQSRAAGADVSEKRLFAG